MKAHINLLIMTLFLFSSAKTYESLTLEQALELAMNQNPEILLAKVEINASLGKRLQMEAFPNPEIVFSSEGNPLGKGGYAKGEKETSFGIQQYLEFPGKRSTRGTIGKYGEEISRLELDRVKMIIRAKVKKAYYKAVLSQKTLLALEFVSDLIDQFIESATIRYQLGTIPYLDVLRARVEKARIQNQWIEVQKELKQDKTILNLLLGKNGDEPLNLVSDIAFIPFEKDLVEMKEEVLRTRPSLRIAFLKLEQAMASLKLSKMSYYPDFTLCFYFPSLRVGAWGAALGFSLPLYWWKKQKGQILEAKALGEMDQISTEATKRRIISQLENAYQGVKAAEEQVKVFEQKLLREIEDELKIGIDNYQYGKIDALNLLDIYRTYTLTRQEHLKALYLYLVSLADLEVAGEELFRR